MKRTAILLPLCALALSGCLANTAPADVALADPRHKTDIGIGLWHGVLAPVTYPVEALRHAVHPGSAERWHVYENNNAGLPYGVGFYGGLIACLVFLLGRLFAWLR